MQRRSGACRIEGAAQRLAVDGNHAVASLGEARHEGLKARAEALWIKLPEHATERIVAGKTARQRKELAQKRLLLHREIRHVHA